jgi:hypothetical protein
MRIRMPTTRAATDAQKNQRLLISNVISGI